MSCCDLPREPAIDGRNVAAHEVAYERICRTTAFRNGGFHRWSAATIGIVGLGLLGGRLALEIVRSGAAVWGCDPDAGSPVNLGNQLTQTGVAKVRSIIQDCNAIRPGRASGVVADIRHVGVGVLRRFQMLIDCTDDPMLALPLTAISNGLGIPLLRCAVDGSGQAEMGRVLCSHGGSETHACQLCSYSAADLLTRRPRTPCPGQPSEGPPPTLAGGALGMAIAGIGLLQAQRLITGNDSHLVCDREIVLDLSHGRFVSVAQSRSERCLSGHIRWEVENLERLGSDATLAGVFEAARPRSLAGISLEPYAHPLRIAAVCDCGAGQEAFGTRWATPPQCPRCGRATSWRDDVQIDRLTPPVASELGILNIRLDELGFPDSGAMFVLRQPGNSPIHLVLE
jgi:hypothetical protein